MNTKPWDSSGQARRALQGIVADPQYGTAALSQPAVMSNLLKDFLPDEPREAGLLVAAAQACGMDADQVRQRLAGDEDVDVVSAEARSFETAGVNGVPYFILGGIFAVSGAQEPEYLVEAIERTVAERARREAAEMAQA